ncbi:hypothetical protein HA402_010313 [Bradysia odoriphaga]|nr:hypothetical protein HA402_010313 [Bradysia odoriphaga]
MRTTIEDNKKYFQNELWTCQQSLTKTNSESISLLNAKKETKKVEFVDVQQSTLDQAERQLDSADSIGKEMTHFKPIRLMPLSAIYISDKIIKIPSIRHTNPMKGAYFFQAPAKSKFKPEHFTKTRRSAFCLVSDTSTNQKANKSQDTTDSGERNVAGRRNGEKSKEKIICNIMLNKANCKRMIQEKGDFELAKMLQECDSIGRTENGNGCDDHSLTKDQEPSARTKRYYLRTRSKQISDAKDETLPTKKVKLVDGINKVVVNGRKTRSSAPLNGDYASKVNRVTRGRKK